MPETTHDTLDALRARLEETRLHAERLAEEAARVRRSADTHHGTGSAPDDGAPDTEPPPDPATAAAPVDLQSVVALLETLRALVPPELQQQLAEVTREVLVLLRALIDWWVDRLEDPPVAPHRAGPSPTGAPAAQDIPVR